MSKLEQIQAGEKTESPCSYAAMIAMSHTFFRSKPEHPNQSIFWLHGDKATKGNFASQKELLDDIGLWKLEEIGKPLEPDLSSMLMMTEIWLENLQICVELSGAVLPVKPVNYESICCLRKTLYDTVCTKHETLLRTINI